MNTFEAFYGPNAGYALELYERYRDDPDSVDAETRAFFETLGDNNGAGGRQAAVLARELPPAPAEAPRNGRTAQAALSEDQVQHVVLAARLARGIREYGHLSAHLDPLGSAGPGDPMLEAATHGLTDDTLRGLPGTIVFPNAGSEAGTCLDAIRRLREIYCGPLGYDFDHVVDFKERAWLHGHVEDGTFRRPLPPDERRTLLRRLTEVEAFERYLHTAFQGQKRFSIEGNDALVPMLELFVERAEAAGTREVLIGMAHRGRLNVLAHVLGKPYAAIFSEFQTAAKREEAPSEGSETLNEGWTGDVKYHLGATRTVEDGEAPGVQVTLAHNPSHLEFVGPVVEGFTRSAQDDRRRRGAPVQDPKRALAITVHGDAAFPGEGVVAETLNLSRLPGYGTGGTIRIIVNNQIGFTTMPGAARSTLYASDLAKGFEIPIVHVNADDPEACLAAVRMAHAYREEFHKDFLIDLVGYRRWGHNEGDEPRFTQPDLYDVITGHPTVRELYGGKLIAEGVTTSDDAAEMMRRAREHLQRVRDDVSAADELEAVPVPVEDAEVLSSPPTGVPAEKLRALNEALLQRPEGFSTFPRLERLIDRRREQIDSPGGIDWGFAEVLAFASILADGTPIRLSGQDTERGTFSQRHLVLHDPATGEELIPLQVIPQARGSFAVYNSPLTEAAVMGFEYGYSVHAPDTLVLWEAQFGDFANAGQVIIDQFLAASRAKWLQQPALTLLLPHGYEGQGPEHSSARLERYLQLAAEGNLRIANCSTAAQYFHLLRLQASTLGDDRRPLIIMTPKSLLRLPGAASSLDDLAHGSFRAVIDDPRTAAHPDQVNRLVLCSGKVAYDLLAARERAGDPSRTAVVRVELLYPFPADAIRTVLQRYGEAEHVIWAQEEPCNMGAWWYIEPRLRALLPDGVSLTYVGRPERAATAEGSPEAHVREQARIVEVALGQAAVQPATESEVQNVG